MAFRWENDELALFDEAISGGSDFCSSEAGVAGDQNQGSIVWKSPYCQHRGTMSWRSRTWVRLWREYDEGNSTASIILYSIMIFPCCLPTNDVIFTLSHRLHY